MKKYILLWSTILFMIPLISFARLSLSTDGHIGAMYVGDNFSVDKYQNILGNLINIKNDQTYNGNRFRTLVFEKGSIYLRNDNVVSVWVHDNYGIDGLPLGTPRGIVVGHELKTVLHLYGTPDRIHMYRNLRWYTYSAGDGAGLSFGINPATNRVSEISASGVGD